MENKYQKAINQIKEQVQRCKSDNDLIDPYDIEDIIDDLEGYDG